VSARIAEASFAPFSRSLPPRSFIPLLTMAIPPNSEKFSLRKLEKGGQSEIGNGLPKNVVQYFLPGCFGSRIRSGLPLRFKERSASCSSEKGKGFSLFYYFFFSFPF
jgi:hypothetical protein